MRRWGLGSLGLLAAVAFACSTETSEGVDDGGAGGAGSGGDEGGASGGSSSGGSGASSGSGGDSAGGSTSSGGASSGGADMGGMGGLGGMSMGSGGGSSDSQGTVSVEAFVEGGFADGAKIMVSAPNGDFVETVIADEFGRATLTNFPVGGFVTVSVFDETRDVHFLFTRAGVGDGDRLVFGEYLYGQGTLTRLTGTRAESTPAGQTYRLHRRFGNGTIGTNYQSNFSRSVLDTQGAFNFIVRAEDGDEKTIASAAFLDVAVAGVGDTVLNIEAGDFTTNLGTHEFTLTNDTGGTVSTVFGDLYGMRDGILYFDPLVYEPSLTDEASISVDDKFDPLFFNRVHATARIESQSGDMNFTQAQENTLSTAAAGTTKQTSTNLSELPISLDGVVLDFATMKFDLSAVTTPSCKGTDAQALVVSMEADGAEWHFQQPYSSSVDIPDIDPAVLAAQWTTSVYAIRGSALIYPGGSYAEHFTGPRPAYDIDQFLDSLPGDTTICASRVEYAPEG